jgi:hypothetical protein
MSEGTGYIIRMNGKLLGPFGLAQLKGFRDKGKLRPEHELSVDREHWFSAGQIPELFPAVQSSPTYGFAQEEPAQASGEVEWYVEIEGERRGPLSESRLKSLIAAGKVEEEDLVWRSGLPDWQPAEDFPQLFEDLPAASSSMARTRRPKESSNGVWDRFLDALRGSVTEKDLEKICQSMLMIGRISMLTGAFAVATYFTCLAVVRNELATGGFAALALIMLLSLQYVGQRMGRAAHRLASASAYRLSSNAFPNALAVALMASGILIAAFGVLSQINRSAVRSPATAADSDAVPIIISIVVGIEVLLPFLYAAHAALHPSWSNVDCSAEVCAGEEGLGCVAYILKMGLRFVPIVFGVSACLGALGALAALAMYAAGPPLRIDSFEVLFAALASLVLAAVFPLVWYVHAGIFSAILDFMAPSVRASSAHAGETRRTR